MTILRDNYWRVNSYGYPNPFSGQANAQQAWETFLTFFDRRSYSSLKAYWASGKASRQISPHALESWKATFEEFGLVYVPAGSDEIRITPAGHQFRQAGEAGNEHELAWIGVSLLLRYPLRGPRARRTGGLQDSDLLLYWFVFAAMRELGNYLWWSELQRVLSRVFFTSETGEALAAIRQLRDGSARLEEFPLPDVKQQGFYNSLNQVMVHASMNYMLIDKSTDEAYYGDAERRHQLVAPWVPLIDTALGLSTIDWDCQDKSNLISRIPKAPVFDGDEESYFAYAGAPVDDMPLSGATSPSISTVTWEGGLVPILRHKIHFSRSDENTIRGKVQDLCSIARGQRIILTDDQSFTYLVRDKVRIGPSEVRLSLRRARPITNLNPIRSYFEETE